MSDAWPLPAAPIAEEVGRFAEAHHLDRRSREVDERPEFPRREFRAMGETGLLGLATSKDRGGRGLSLPEAAVGLYHLAYRGGTVFGKISLQPEFSSVLADHGDPSLVDRWFRPLVRGEVLVGNQITEAGAGSDASALATVAERLGDAYVLSGEKTEVAHALDAEAALVYARSPGSSRHRGISVFLVPQDLPGVRRVPGSGDLGERWQRRGSVVYERAKVPLSHRIGAEGEGFSYVRPELVRERGLLAAVYLGVARASWEETVRYVGERATFGHALSDDQAVAFPLVDDGAALVAAWRYTVHALEQLDAGRGGEGTVSMAKAMAAEVALRAIDHAIQFHGGRGYSRALPHEQRWRDVRSGSIAHGASEVIRRAMARELWPRKPPANP